MYIKFVLQLQFSATALPILYTFYLITVCSFLVYMLIMTVLSIKEIITP